MYVATLWAISSILSIQLPLLSSFFVSILLNVFCRKSWYQRKISNLGYAFVNFTNAVAAFKFFNSFHKHVWMVSENSKTCEVTLAELQVCYPCILFSVIHNTNFDISAYLVVDGIYLYAGERSPNKQFQEPTFLVWPSFVPACGFTTSEGRFKRQRGYDRWRAGSTRTPETPQEVFLKRWNVHLAPSLSLLSVHKFSSNRYWMLALVNCMGDWTVSFFRLRAIYI